MLNQHETQPMEGTSLAIPFAEIAAYYFPEGSSPPRRQMCEKFQFFCDIFQRVSQEMVSPKVKGASPYPISFRVSVDSLLPVIKQRISSRSLPSLPPLHSADDFQTLDPRGSEYNLRMKDISGPVFNLVVNCGIDDFYEIMMTKLEEADQVERIDPVQLGLSEECRVFSMPGEKDKMGVQTLGDNVQVVAKMPLLIIEKDKTMSGTPVLSMRLAVDTDNDCQNAREFSPARDLFRFVIKSSVDPSIEDVISWGNERPRLIFRDVPTVHISARHTEALAQPMDISEFGIKKIIDEAIHIFQQNPNFIRTFPMGYQEFASSLYYLHLAKLTAKMVYQAVVDTVHHPQRSAISAETQTFIQNEFRHLRDQDRQFAMNTLIFMGFDIWKELDDIAYQLASAVRHDPDTFWSYFTALGLDNLFPSANRSLETFSLFPELGQYVDHRPGKEHAQPDEYFMNICLALAWYAESIGEEPFGSVVVRDGKIVGAGHNEIKKHHGVQTRHAEIIAIERAQRVLNDLTLNKCTIYTTASPCDMCAYNIRTSNGIKRVCIGVDSSMKGSALQSSILAEQGPPFGEPPNVEQIETGDLKRKFRELYIETMGWRTQFPALATEPPPDRILL